jgi:signal transduction histidine kinase
MASIRRRVLASAVLTLAVGALLALPLTYLVTLEDVDELFDIRLRQTALSVLASGAGAPPGAVPAADAADAEDDIELVTEVWGLDGRRIFSTHPEAGLPRPETDGASQVRLQGVWWHVHAVTGAGRRVQAAQPAAERTEMAIDAAWNLGAALLMVFAAVGAVLVWVLRAGLGALDRAAAAVATRSEHALAPIGQSGVPDELAPLVQAINGLLRRLDVALSHQRRFVADAAHQLRTPVTALALQWTLLDRAPDVAARSKAAAELGAGIARTQRLVTQLLDLSRAEPDAPMDMQTFDLAALVQEVVGEYTAPAAQRGVALGAAAGGVVALAGDQHAIGVLLHNLIDNALRHAGSAGRIQVEATLLDGRPALRVCDHGPGIAAAERERVLDRFYRSVDAQELDAEVGSGLGLAIVRAIAERHGATLSLQDRVGGPGLEVRVVF